MGSDPPQPPHNFHPQFSAITRHMTQPGFTGAGLYQDAPGSSTTSLETIKPHSPVLVQNDVDALKGGWKHSLSLVVKLHPT